MAALSEIVSQAAFIVCDFGTIHVIVCELCIQLELSNSAMRVRAPKIRAKPAKSSLDMPILRFSMLHKGVTLNAS